MYWILNINDCIVLCTCRLYVWNMEKLLANAGMAPSSPGPTDAVLSDLSASLADSWVPPAQPCSLTDTLVSVGREGLMSKNVGKGLNNCV